MECKFWQWLLHGTAVSSAGSNASNLGIFEYDVPSGFTYVKGVKRIIWLILQLINYKII